MMKTTLPAAASLALLAPVAFAAVAALAACQPSAPEPTPDRTGAAAGGDNNNGTKSDNGDNGAKTADAPVPPHRRFARPPQMPVANGPSPDDPLKGVFSLDDATKGLPPGKQLLATIDTGLGKIECKLFDDKSPNTVANFVGLARGIRPWKTPQGTWEKKPAYDGTTFHRVIKGFMIQGGDAKGDGSGEPGYVIPDEVWGNHDRAGLLCMANRGHNTNGAQFFITDAAAAHLDNNYTIFGECGPLDVVHSIANVPVRGDHPNTPPEIKKITITRK